MALEEWYRAAALWGNAARRDICDRAASELEAGMRDVHFVGQNRNAHGLHLGHWLLDQREQNVEIVNHQVIDNIHSQAARCEYPQAMHFEKQRVVEDGLDGQYRGIESFQMPDLKQALIAVCGIDESIRLGEGLCHGLFHENVEADPEQTAAHFRVVGSRYRDARRVRAAAQFIEICESVRAEFLGGGLRPLRIFVEDADQIGVLDFTVDTRVIAAELASTNTCDTCRPCLPGHTHPCCLPPDA